MDIQSIFHAGGTIVRNPNYNGKDDSQPEYINVADLDSNAAPSNSLASQGLKAAAAGKQNLMGKNGELDKYINHGLTPNGIDNLDRYLIEQQGTLTKFGNALAQAAVSEVALGTAKSFSDIADFVGKYTGLSDGDYSNPVSQFLEEKQEEFRNYAPIYSDPNLNLFNGGLLDAGWWASNLPSTVSSLTMLLPSTGIVKGLAAIGKLAKIGAGTRRAIRAISGAEKRLKQAEALRNEGKSLAEITKATELTKVQKFLTSEGTAKQTALFLENGTTAVLSRAMENYQEARQTYNDMCADATDYFSNDKNFKDFVKINSDELDKAGIDKNNKDAVAKYVAEHAADRTFQIDWLNVVSDVVQMYALKNAWKGMKNAAEDPASVRRANLDAAKYLGKNKAEIKAIKAQRKFSEKAREKASDILYGGKLAITAELGEGVEEAVNYIATQEGMHLGNLMLGKEIGEKQDTWENIISGFDGRLIQYLQDPSLYDSAFWGVAGGVLFQYGGSKFRRLANKVTDRKSDASEEAKKQLPWYKLDELPENKRRITDIEQRSIDFNDYNDKLKRINNGEDIYKSTKDNKVEFTNEYEKEAAKEKLTKEFIAKMTLRSMNSGNYNLLREYLEDDNLRKAFIEQGLFTDKNGKKTTSEIERESKEFINDALRTMKEVEEMYDSEIVAVNSASYELSKSFTNKDDMQAEYIQIIATNNVYTRLGIANNQKDLAALNNQIASLEEHFKDRLDPNINYANSVRLAVLTNTLGQLRAQRKRLAKDTKSLSNRISIKEVDKQITALEKELSDAELMYATEQSLRYTLNDDGKYTTEDTPEAFQYRDALIEKRGAVPVGSNWFANNPLFEGVSKRARTVVDDTIFGEYEVLEQDTNKGLSEINSISPDLNKAYANKAALELQNKFMSNKLARTVDEVRDAAGVLHNTMNEARVNAINTAHETLFNLYDKYGNDIRDYIRRVYIDGEKLNAKDYANISESDRRMLSDAMNVINLSKASNQSLVGAIDDMFDLQDNIKVATEVKDDGGVSEENSTNSEVNTGTENSNLNNNTDQTNATNTEQNKPQNSTTSDQIDPQNISNRKPSFNVAFYNNKGQFVSGKANSNNNNNVDVYDNNDGTYTIDPKGSIRNLNNPNFFETAGSVDLTRPYEITSYPIAQRNAKGELVIVQKGTTRNTDTVEYREEQAAKVEKGEPIDEGKPTKVDEAASTETASKETSPSEVKPQSNPSTGGLEVIEGKPQETTKLQEPEDSALFTGEKSTEDAIKNDSLAQFQQAYKENHDVDFDELARQIIDQYVKDGQDRNLVEACVNKSKEVLKRYIERRSKAKEKSMKSSVDEVIVEQVNPLEKAYKDSVDNMMEQYVKELGLVNHNGKYYVNLENLLRYVNTITNDKGTASWIFESLKSYLTSDEAKQKYILTDEDNDLNNSNKFLNNVSKTAQERYIEKVGDNLSYGVDINSVAKMLTTEQELTQFYKALDNLQKGDKLGIKITKGAIHITDKEGTVIGTLPIPKIDSSTGAYVMTNDGWVSDVLQSNNGEYESKLKDLFLRWVNPTNEYAKQINDIVYELLYAKPSEERKQELLKLFAENPEIKLAKSQGFISSTASNNQLLNGLYKLFRHIEHSKKGIKKDTFYIEESINNWFEKLYNSYSNVMALKNGEVTNITVNTISDGELIRIADKSSKEASLPANKALAGGANSDVYKVGVVFNNTLSVSGKESIPVTNMKNGNTFVLIPNRNGSYEYVKAYLADVTDDYIGTEAKEIVQAIKDNIISLLNNYAKNLQDNNAYNTITSFITKTYFSQANKESLFYGLVVSTNGDYFVINSPSTQRKIVIKKGYNKLIVTHPEFEKNKHGYQQKEIDISSKEAERHISELINNTRFNINTTYINSDNNTSLATNGITSRNKDGKFEITIGNKHWTYDSYNDFILKNDLVKLNTKPNEAGTSNFSRKASRGQNANQILTVKSERQTSSPVKGLNERTTSATTSEQATKNTPINDKVDTILASEDEHINKGLEIAKLVFEEDDTTKSNKQVLNVFDEYNLLPKDITFDEMFNARSGFEIYNASSDPKTGKVIVGTKWLNQFKDPTQRKRAIRILVHEQLHIKLREKPGYIKSAQEIYNDFEKSLKDKNIPEDAHIRVYLFKNYDSTTAVEEFLVESLTNKELVDYLNSVDATFDKKGGARNLFQKIMQFLSEVFGWDIKKGSLYEKEFYTLRDIFKGNNTENNIKNDKSKQVEAEENKEEIKSPIEVKDVEDNHENDYDSNYMEDEDEKFSSVDEIDRSDYTNEMLNILHQSISEGSYMKASNGKQTNLNERQWLQVRTKNFKNWFGDWEKDKENASKVVDENGEPLVVYHGTDFEFNTFKTTLDLEEVYNDELNYVFTVPNSIYATSNKTISETYYENESFLDRQLAENIEFIEEAEYKGIYTFEESKEKIQKLIKESNERKKTIKGKSIPLFVNIRDVRIIDAKNSNWNKINDNGIIKSTRTLEEENRDKDGVIINNVFDYGGREGYIAYTSSTIFIINKANNVKSATDNNGDFSTTNDDTRYSSVDERISTNSLPSVLSMQQRLPLEQQAKFADLVASAEINSSCR